MLEKELDLKEKILRNFTSVALFLTTGFGQQTQRSDIQIDFDLSCQRTYPASYTPILLVNRILGSSENLDQVVITLIDSTLENGGAQPIKAYLFFPDISGRVPPINLEDGKDYTIALREVNWVNHLEGRVGLGELLFVQEFKAPVCNLLKAFIV